MHNLARSERINRSARLALIAGLALGACGDGDNALPQLTTTTSEVASTLPELTTPAPTESPALPNLPGNEARNNPADPGELPYEAILESGALQPLTAALTSLIDSERASIYQFWEEGTGKEYYEITTQTGSGHTILFLLDAPGDETKPDLLNIRELYVEIEAVDSPPDSVVTYMNLFRSEVDGVDRLQVSGNLDGIIFTTEGDISGDQVVGDPAEAAELAAETAASVIAALDR